MTHHDFEARRDARRAGLVTQLRAAAALPEDQRKIALAMVDTLASIFVLGRDLVQASEARGTSAAGGSDVGALPTAAGPVPDSVEGRPMDELSWEVLSWSEDQAEAVMAACRAALGRAERAAMVKAIDDVQCQKLFESCCRELTGREATTEALVELLASTEPHVEALAPILFMAPGSVARPDREQLIGVVRDGARWMPLRAAALLLLDHWELLGPSEPGAALRGHLAGDARALAVLLRRRAWLMGVKLAEGSTPGTGTPPAP